MSKLDDIRAKAIDLVAEAMEDDEIPAARRADMALSLLGKQAIKEQQEDPAFEPVEVWFHEIDESGRRTRSFGYEFVPKHLSEQPK